MPTIRTLCTGGGGFDIGAHQAGYVSVDGFEINDKIASVARLNGLNVYTADITRVDYNHLPPVDHLHASPSCKTASKGNTKGKETADDKAVADAICRAINAHQGNTFTLENVWGYRNYESFQRILGALIANGFIYEFSNRNMADWGVPQTRERLILRAIRGADRIPTMHPTHRKHGDMFHQPWIGWLEAVQDIIHTFPRTQPAQWQVQRLARMPKYSELIHPTDMRTMPTRRADQPAFTMVAGSGKRASGNYPRAFVMDGQANSRGEALTVRDGNDPMFTLTSTMDKRPTRAYLCGGGNTNLDNPTSLARYDDEPAFTLRNSSGGSPDRAFFPSSGYWIKIPIQGLMRFQTFPDDYKGMTIEINGNAVPPLMARRIMESLCLA